MNNKSVKCLKCGWVHFEVSRTFAESEVKSFNIYFNTLSKQVQNDYYGGHGATLALYEKCSRCGGSYKNFRDATDAEKPYGSTVGPIIDRNQ